MANSKNIISSEDAIALLNKWKGGSAKVCVASAFSGVQWWFVGEVVHASRSELHFGVPGIDSKDFLFVVVCSDARFSVLTIDEPTSYFFSPRRDFRDFGGILEVALGKPRNTDLRVIIAELFPAKCIDAQATT